MANKLCIHCNAIMFRSKKGRFYCSRICWKEGDGRRIDIML